jgi:molybdenum cofactor biosynthesis enzyme MoaA
MLKPNQDPIYVRASVWPKCNLNCIYCPVSEGMENRVPDTFAGNKLTTPEYLRNLVAISKAGVGGVSFTGGEPTLRADLGHLIQTVRPYFERVELTTNGVRLASVADAVKANVDLLKVSLDSPDPDMVQQMTGHKDAFRHAVAAINWAVQNGVNLGVNVVVMRSTLTKIDKIIEYVRSLTLNSSSAVYLSLLDFYYSPSRRQEWLQEFVPTSSVLEQLYVRFGNPTIHDRFGCRFYWFDADGLRIRLKDSFSATMRADKCGKCPSYCQEGVYGVKHSAEGWFTTCPSNDENKGVYLNRNLNDDELAEKVELVLVDVKSAVLEHRSFEQMCAVHALHGGHKYLHNFSSKVAW